MQLAPAPEPLAFGVKMIGPVLIAFGTQEQKQQFLPRIANLDDWWCQGFSEPGAGSDLASLQDRAVRDGDHYVINGQKTWTTRAQHANWIFVPGAHRHRRKKQQGITFLLMRHEDARHHGAADHDARRRPRDQRGVPRQRKVPVENRVGEENKGWDSRSTCSAMSAAASRASASRRRSVRRLKEMASLERVGDKPLIEDERFARKSPRSRSN